MNLDFRDGCVPADLSESGALAEATREELATLLYCLCRRELPEVSEIARAIGASDARVRASLAYWEATELPSGNVRHEFPSRLRAGELREESAAEVARTIRDGELASLMEECARLLGKPTLSGKDAHNITALYTQYGLTEEYIVTLLSDLVRHSMEGRTTVNRLVNTALRLADEGIETIDALNEHFRLHDATGEWERSVRRILGIYGRALSPSEKERFARWTEVYGYADDIITKAYDITVGNTGKASSDYMDKILTAWNAAGLHTLAECERYNEEHRAEASAKAKGKPQKSKEKERLGTFDPEEAFRLALERSYGGARSDAGTTKQAGGATDTKTSVGSSGATDAKASVRSGDSSDTKMSARSGDTANAKTTSRSDATDVKTTAKSDVDGAKDTCDGDAAKATDDKAPERNDRQKRT